MIKRDIIVIGASAGGFEAIKKIVSDLPSDLEASVFIVWHMAADAPGVLPAVLNRLDTLPASYAAQGEDIRHRRIYVAPPDHHLILEKKHVKVSKGPKENRFRPAIDPLFRSAALSYGQRVIGVILSGGLDDGSAGLWSIKEFGGTAVVQDPLNAEVSSMPESALRSVDADHVLSISEIGPLLKKLVDEPLPEENKGGKHENKLTDAEIRIAMEDKALKQNLLQFGTLTPYTCPECHGVLSAIKEGGRLRFRCHTGHGFSADSLLVAVTENIEENLWNAIRNIQESIMLLNHMGDHFAEVNEPKVAAMYFKKAKDAEKRAELVRQAVFNHEQLNADGIRSEAKKEVGGI
jgi:two-component system, chemotaxis family, protein-glutamate methylesterase/glutaminase